TAASGELVRDAPGGVMGNGLCQRPPSTFGLAQVVLIAPSGPIQKTSSAPLRRVTAESGELARETPGDVMGNGLCQRPPSTAGLAQVVAIAPSGPIQKTSSAPSRRVMAARGELAREAPGGVIGKGVCHLAESTAGFAQLVAIALSPPI